MTTAVEDTRYTVVIDNDAVTVATVGTQGPEGVGVPAAGDTGQLLAKSAAGDFSTEWTNALLRPSVTLTVKNSTGDGMAKGDLVYVTGVSAGVPTVEPANASAEATASGMLLLVNETIAAAASGKALVFGYMAGLTGPVAGTIFYASTTAGDFTSTKPSATGEVVRVIGYGLSTTELFFSPDPTWVVWA